MPESLPPTKEGIECYKAIYKAESDLEKAFQQLRQTKKSLAQMHKAFDVLRESLGRDLPSKEEIRQMKNELQISQDETINDNE